MFAIQLPRFSRVSSDLRPQSGANCEARTCDAGFAFVSRLKQAFMLVVVASAVAAGGCSTSVERMDSGQEIGYSPRVTPLGAPVPKGGGRRKIGQPYMVAGVRYVPREEPGYDRVGVASWYGRDFHGRLTANGEVYDMGAMTAAHPTLPLPSLVRVTNLQTRQSIVVRVNDRGPFKRGRIIDLSRRAADELGFAHHGTAQVRVKYLGPAPL